MVRRVVPGSVSAALCAAAVVGLFVAGCTIDPTGTGAATQSGGGGPGGAGPGSGGGTTTTTTTTTTTGAGGQGGTGGGPMEDCLDGVDNDGDGDPDCADTDCTAGFECVPEAPASWTGPLRVEQEPYPADNSVPTCPGGANAATLFVGPAIDAQCAACTCDVGGATCTAPEITCHLGVSDCNGGFVVSFQPTTASCSIGPATVAGASSCQVTGGPAVNGSACMTTGGEVENSKWQQELHVCELGAAGGGCAAGSVCVPKAAPELTSVCVMKNGSDACPPGWVDQDLQAYQDGTDTRTCSQCGCSVACSGGAITIHDVSNCTGMFLDLTMSCSSLGDYTDGASGLTSQLGMPSIAMCTQAVGTGDVQGTAPTKVCCAP